jgi:hypothetical protein
MISYTTWDIIFLNDRRLQQNIFFKEQPDKDMRKSPVTMNRE